MLSEPRLDEVDDRHRHRRPAHRLHVRDAWRRSPSRCRAPAAPAGAVHLKVDTGMHRVGAAPADVVPLAKAIGELAEVGSRACAPTAPSPTSPTTPSQTTRSPGSASTPGWVPQEAVASLPCRAAMTNLATKA